MISEFEVLYSLAAQEIQENYDYIGKSFSYPNANIASLNKRKASLDLLTRTINAAEQKIKEQEREIQLLRAQHAEKRIQERTFTELEKAHLYQKICYDIAYQQFKNPHLTDKNKELAEAIRMFTIQKSNNEDKIFPLYSQRQCP